MLSPCGNCQARHACQPIGREYTTANGAFVKEMDLAEAGMVIPQHAHAYEHISYVARGAVLFEGRLVRSPEAITVPANRTHTFQSMEPDTLVLCIHAAKPVITQEHQLVKEN